MNALQKKKKIRTNSFARERYRKGPNPMSTCQIIFLPKSDQPLTKETAVALTVIKNYVGRLNRI